MNSRGALTLFWGYVIAATLLLTFPGIVPFNRQRPFLLGMPFVLVWVALWVVLAFCVFLAVDRVLGRTGDGKEG